MNNFDDMKFAVESISGAATVLLDDLGMPSIMVAIPKLLYSDIKSTLTGDTLPAFIVDGVEKNKLYQSKFQNVVMNGRAYSWAMKDPRANINFDTALAACRAKGSGWHLQSNALWAAIMGWCYANNTVPGGNTNYGAEYNAPHKKGIPAYINPGDGKTYRTATGSGPASWYHDFTKDGIADLVGNIWEWVAGLRIVNGEIQVIPYGNCMKSDCNMGASSTEWKAIMPDGTLVDPGTAGTLKLDGATASSGVRLNTTIQYPTSGDGYFTQAFSSLAAADGVSIPQLLYGLGLAPITGVTYGNGIVFIRNHEAERLPFRGGDWYNTAYAGLPALNLANPRSYSHSNVGFRAAFYETL
jgi:hypothetical protein